MFTLKSNLTAHKVAQHGLDNRKFGELDFDLCHYGCNHLSIYLQCNILLEKGEVGVVMHAGLLNVCYLVYILSLIFLQVTSINVLNCLNEIGSARNLLFFKLYILFYSSL